MWLLLVYIGAGILRGSMLIICRYYSTALIWQGYSVSLGLDCLVKALRDGGLYCRSYTI